MTIEERLIAIAKIITGIDARCITAGTDRLPSLQEEVRQEELVKIYTLAVDMTLPPGNWIDTKLTT